MQSIDLRLLDVDDLLLLPGPLQNGLIVLDLSQLLVALVLILFREALLFLRWRLIHLKGVVMLRRLVHLPRSIRKEVLLFRFGVCGRATNILLNILEQIGLLGIELLIELPQLLFLLSQIVQFVHFC